MSLVEESLETAANGGQMDIEKWPNIVEPLLERLEYIVYNVFTMPQMPPDAPPSVFQPSLNNPSTSSFLQDPNSIPSSSNKENAAPLDLRTPPRPPTSSLVPLSSTERVPDSQPASQTGGSNNRNLPAPLLLILDSIRSTIRSLFSSKPPHTIQRLAELILRPNAHYRTLPAYLRAVDRVVSVTSSADIFPLPMQTGATAQPNGVMNGADSAFLALDNALGSDESLGGALLTPIPWLSNVASPEADSGIMDDASQTLQPQDQTLLSSTDLTQQQTLHTTTNSGSGAPENDMMEGTSGPSTDESSEEIPHARGPSILGVEDLGLQDGKGVEMTLLNSESVKFSDTTTSANEQVDAVNQQHSSTLTAAVSLASNEDADGDGDITLEDEDSSSSVVLPSTTTTTAESMSDQRA